MRTAQQPTFEELYAQYGDGLYRYCFRLCRGNEADAEDLAQETLILAFRHLEGFKGKSKVQTWLYRIALNVHLKRRSKASEGDEELGEQDPGVDPTGGQVTRLWLESGLSALPDALYQAIVLVKAEGLTHKEAAAVLGVPQGTVQFRVHEAVKRLRKILTEDPRSPYVGAFLPASLLDTELSRWGNVSAPATLEANVLEALRNPATGSALPELPEALRPSATQGPMIDRRTVLAGGGMLGLVLGGMAVVKTTRLVSPTKDAERIIAAMSRVRTAQATGTFFQGDISRGTVLNIRRYRADYAFSDPANFVRRLMPIEGSSAAVPEELLSDGNRTTRWRGPAGGVWGPPTNISAEVVGNTAPFDFFSGHSALAQALRGRAKTSTTTGHLAGEEVRIVTVQQHQATEQRRWVLHSSAKTGRVLRCEYVKQLQSRGVWLQVEYALLDSWAYDQDLPETIFRPSPRPPSG